MYSLLKFLVGELKEQNLSKLGTADLQLVSFWFWNDLVMKTSYISKQINNIQVHIIVAILESFGKMKQLINCSVVISTHKIRNKLIVKSVNQHKGQYTQSLLCGCKKPSMQLSFKNGSCNSCSVLLDELMKISSYLRHIQGVPEKTCHFCFCNFFNLQYSVLSTHI